ncbi:MAG: chemotaxis protein CheB [Phycisphaerales bacterium]|nr:chemotaxis protein CheB [Phycisphaerales bacterium]
MPAAQVPVYRPGQFDVVCIGSSTGGPPVLETILSALPETLSAPVVVAQHMPELFTRSMAERLAQVCKLRVLHAEDRMPLEHRTIYIAPGGKHIHLNKLGLVKWELLVNSDPKEALYKPSVDALFASAATAMGARTLAVVLTGIGEDGLLGARDLHAKTGSSSPRIRKPAWFTACPRRSLRRPSSLPRFHRRKSANPWPPLPNPPVQAARLHHLLPKRGEIN